MLVTVQLKMEVLSTFAAGIVTTLPTKLAKLVAGFVFPIAALPALASRQLTAVNRHCTAGCVSVKVMAVPAVDIGTLVSAAVVVETLSAVVTMFVSAVGKPLVPTKPKFRVVAAPPSRILLMLILGLMMVGSFAVLLAVLISPPPETVTLLVNGVIA